MLNFFRRIRQSQFYSGAARKPASPLGRYILYAVGEILLVMVGILLALQVNNWNEENKNEKKGIEYLNSLSEDLIQDSIHLSYLISQYQTKMSKLSAMEVCYDSIVTRSGEDCIKSLISVSSYFDNLRNVDRTIQQLKYEGGSSLLSPEDWNRILEYDMTIASYKIDETTVFQETQTSLRTLMHELIDFGSYNTHDPSEKRKVLIQDNHVLNKYFNTLKRYGDYCSDYVDRLHEISDLNDQLKTYIQKKYQFK